MRQTIGLWKPYLFLNIHIKRLHGTADFLLMTIYQFGRCELDTEKHRLLVAGIERNVEPQVFELLHFLVESGDSLVSQQDLIESVWKGRVVTDSAISVRINAARKSAITAAARRSSRRCRARVSRWR